MSKFMDPINYWNTTIHQDIPATKLLGITIQSLSEQAIQVTAPLEQNINGHQTAFAGSIYTLGITSGWTLISAFLKSNNIKASVVAGQADISYKRPIAGDLIANCQFDNQSPLINWQQSWSLNKSAKQPLIIEVSHDAIVSAKITATFYIKKIS
ncbi:YiiD C-terminal domain-containing protein [Pleionea mediterranea]|nr:YiiD C-terminal domain-containing protein [Pleionea mediterranea]